MTNEPSNNTTVNFPDYKIIDKALTNVIASQRIVGLLGGPVNGDASALALQARRKVTASDGKELVTVSSPEVLAMINAVVGNQETVAMTVANKHAANKALMGLKDILRIETSLNACYINLYVKELRTRFHCCSNGCSGGMCQC